MKKKMVIITDIPFWRHIAGHMARITTLITYLKTRVHLTVIYGGFTSKRERETNIYNLSGFKLVTFNKTESGPAEFASFIKNYLLKHSYVACIIEYIELSYLLDSIPAGTQIYLDTHDLKSTREAEFMRHGLSYKKFSWKEEISIMKQYDKVILIQKKEYEKVSGVLGKDKTLLISHAVNLPRQKLRKVVTNIGFIASSYPPNVEGLIWFLKNVWASFSDDYISLSVYGSICTYSHFFSKYRNVNVKGIFNDITSVYSEVDIVINPVRFGAGIKIKNLEALGSGIPLITLPHGATGLEELANKGFLVAVNKTDFLNNLTLLTTDYRMRKSLADHACKFISRYYSPDHCYSPLLSSIQ